MKWSEKTTLRIIEAPYRFHARKGCEVWISRRYKSREAALNDIKRLQKKGYQISGFHNEKTGTALKVPEK